METIAMFGSAANASSTSLFNSCFIQSKFRPGPFLNTLSKSTRTATLGSASAIGKVLIAGSTHDNARCKVAPHRGLGYAYSPESLRQYRRPISTACFVEVSGAVFTGLLRQVRAALLRSQRCHPAEG